MVCVASASEPSDGLFERLGALNSRLCYPRLTAPDRKTLEKTDQVDKLAADVARLLAECCNKILDGFYEIFYMQSRPAATLHDDLSNGHVRTCRKGD